MTIALRPDETGDLAHEPDRQGSIRALSLSGFHRIAYTDWGPADAENTVICVHGLTRQGRDFDYLARRLADAGMRVVCPDLVGRGRSGALSTAAEYVFPQYCSDMGALIASLHAKRLHWVGTSLGGLIGMVLAASDDTPIEKLVINDIGPDVPFSATVRVSTRLALEPSSFATLEDAEAYTRKTYAACGPMSDADWRHMTIHSVRLDLERDRYVLLLDPSVRTAFNLFWYYRMSLWRYWRAIRAPLLLVHGDQSDFMPAGLVDDMRRSQPQMLAYRVAGAGHMPSLMQPDQIEAVATFLAA
jgi:pimeloyl-ACP methyl ester carboxylesterase